VTLLAHRFAPRPFPRSHPLSQHAGYNFEILASLFWSSPALFSGFVVPYFYVMFLAVLLFDRSFRDDDRCAKKYGKYWKEYSDVVPYKIIPGVV